MKSRRLAQAALMMLATLCLNAFGHDSLSRKDDAQKIADLNARIDGIQRDQINYRVEKDLLKETYSSHFQLLNATITIVLGGFTIAAAFLGIIGFKGISAVRKDYNDELTLARQVRESLEKNISEIDHQIIIARDKVAQLVKENQEQDNRLKMLELQEKVVVLFQQGNYQLSLDYAEVALAANPNNSTLLLVAYASCNKLEKWKDAAKYCEMHQRLEPEKISAKMNMIECYLVAMDFDRFDSLMHESMSEMETYCPKYMSWYLKGARLFLSNDDKFLSHILSLDCSDAGTKEQRISGWIFTEIETVAKRCMRNIHYEKFGLTLRFLKGEISYSELTA